MYMLRHAMPQTDRKDGGSNPSNFPQGDGESELTNEATYPHREGESLSKRQTSPDSGCF